MARSSQQFMGEAYNHNQFTSRECVCLSFYPIASIVNRHNPVSLLRFLKLLLNQPIISEDSVKDEEKNRSKRINLDSLLHNVDIHLRKVTNHTIKSKGTLIYQFSFTSDCLWRTQYAKMASDIKAQCLQELHKTISGGNSIWTVENCQKFAEELFYEKLDEVLNKKVAAG